MRIEDSVVSSSISLVEKKSLPLDQEKVINTTKETFHSLQNFKDIIKSSWLAIVITFVVITTLVILVLKMKKTKDSIEKKDEIEEEDKKKFTVTLADGSSFKGIVGTCEITPEGINGKGRLTLPYGTTLEGKFDKDFLVEGSITFPDGTVIAGPFTYSEETKYGETFKGISRTIEKKTTSSGEPYQYSEFTYGTRTSEYSSYIFKGFFKDEMLNGEGTTYWSEGNIWKTGVFKNDKLNGKGTIYDSDGDLKAKGTFKDDQLNGEGEKWWKGELSEKGTFKNDKLNGEGEYYLNGKLSKKGTFKDDNLNGQGEYYLNGKLFEKGTFKDDKLHGKGIRYKEDGIAIAEKGTFENDTLISVE